MKNHTNYLFEALGKYKWHLCGGSVLCFFGNIFQFAIPLVLKGVIDSLTRDRPFTSIYAFCLVLFLLYIAQAVFFFFTRRTVVFASYHVETDLRRDMMRSLSGKSGLFFKKYRTGDLVARFSEDLRQIRTFVGSGLMSAANLVFSFLLAVSIMSMIDWKLTVAAIIPFFAVSILIKFLEKALTEKTKNVQARYGTLNAVLAESLKAILQIKAQTLENSREKIFGRESAQYRQGQLGLARLSSALFPMIAVLSGTATAILIYYGGLKVIRGDLTLGSFVAFNTYLVMLIWPSMALGWLFNQYKRAEASLERIDVILRQGRKGKSGNRKQAEDENAAIEFKNVSFAYPGEKGKKVDLTEQRALDSVSLRIKRGEKIAVCGEIGSGKSTLINLAAGLLSPDKGAIFIGTGAEENGITVLPQQAFLYSGTALENIVFAETDVNRAALDKALKISLLEQDIQNWPGGHEALVGEGGHKISGGQKQRLALARAIYKGGDVFLFDDCFSNMDAETENEVLERLLDSFPGKTLVFVSHRLSTIMKSERVIFMKGGKIIEDGAHKNLLSKRGEYYLYYEKHRIEESDPAFKT